MPPTQLGPYAISTLLGRGGMGAVYEAVDRDSGRAVAVKTLATHLSDDAGIRKRFAGEIEALKSLRHPCIVELLSFGEDDGQPYFAMELVRGKSLEQLLRSGRRFSWRETVDIALLITRALKSAHDHGVVHRDLKPANLLFPDEPVGDAIVKLADFGIARLFSSTGQTMAGMIVGTAEYMAPEQTTGSGVDHRVDLYALGLVLFAMLTGRPPFQGGEVTDVLRRQRQEPPPRVSSLVAGVPQELDDLIERLLAKDPTRRPPSALAVGRQLAVIATTVGVDGATHAASGTADPAVTLGPAAAATDCDESRRRTAGGTVPAAERADIDLEAPTRGFTAAGTAAPEPAVIPGSGSSDANTLPMPTHKDSPTGLPQRVTVPASEAGRGAAARTTRFTTVEELERVSRDEARAGERRDLAIRLAAAVVILGVLAAAASTLLRPPTADELYARMSAILDDPQGDLRDARQLIARFLVEHASDARVEEVKKLGKRLELHTLEQRAEKRRGFDRQNEPIRPGRGDGDKAMPVLEREYRAAMAREAESPIASVAALEAILVLHADEASTANATDDALETQPGLWLDLVRLQLDRLRPLAEREREQDLDRAEEILAEAARLTAQAADAADADTRITLLDRRRVLLESMVEIYGPRPHVSAAVAEARSLLAEGSPKP